MVSPVAQPRVDRQAVGRGVHDHRVGLVHHGVDARRGPERERLPANGFGAAAAHRRRHGAHQRAVGVDADLLGGVVGHRDVGVADGERRGAVLLPVETVAERHPVDVGLHRHRSAWRVVLFGPPVGGLVVHPVPGARDRRGGGDRQPSFGGCPVVDGLVEVRDHDGADSERAAVQRLPAGGGQVDLASGRWGPASGRSR